MNTLHSHIVHVWAHLRDPALSQLAGEDVFIWTACMAFREGASVRIVGPMPATPLPHISRVHATGTNPKVVGWAIGVDDIPAKYPRLRSKLSYAITTAQAEVFGPELAQMEVDSEPEVKIGIKTSPRVGQRWSKAQRAKFMKTLAAKNKKPAKVTKVDGRKAPHNKGKKINRWTEAAVKHLALTNGETKKLNELAKSLGRTPGAVLQKWHWLKTNKVKVKEGVKS